LKIVIPNIPYPDSFEDNVAFTLKVMGHEVSTIPLPSVSYYKKYRYYLNLIDQKLRPNEFTWQEEWLLMKIRDRKPDMVLCLTQILNPQVLHELKKKNVITAAWWGDTAANMNNFAARKLKTLDLNSFYLPEAMNPAWHNKYYSKIADHLVFIGNAYNYRNYLITLLVREGIAPIKLFGSKPPRWSTKEVMGVYQHQEKVKEQKSIEFGSSLACINSTAMSEFDSLNCRTFEIAGAGGFQILEFRESILDCFEPGEELLTFNGIIELTQIVERAKIDYSWVTKIREAGYKRAHTDHTYQKRLELILKKIRE
jgi:spore maturation protein CgeB